MSVAAVIPAPIAYIKIVAGKKLVVEFRVRPGISSLHCAYWPPVLKKEGKRGGGRGSDAQGVMQTRALGSTSKKM